MSLRQTTRTVVENPHTYKPRLFSFAGRIGRLRFFAYFIIYTLTFAALLAAAAWVFIPLFSSRPTLSISGWPIATLVILYLASFLPHQVPTRRRLMDCGHHKNWSFLLWIPFLNLALVVYLLIQPGSDATNTYGAAPRDNPPGLVVFCVVALLAIAAVVILLANGFSGWPTNF